MSPIGKARKPKVTQPKVTRPKGDAAESISLSVRAKGQGKAATAPSAAAKALIRSLGLLPHPEGGFYREVYRSGETVQSDKGPRSAITTIYFLLLRGQKSVFHRVTSDEIWHHYQGAPLRLHRISADFKTGEAVLLGPVGVKAEPAPKAGSRFRSRDAKAAVQVAVIPRGEWQAAETSGEYTLVGCSVGPGFDFADFTLLRDDAKTAERLRKAFPKLSALI